MPVLNTPEMHDYAMRQLKRTTNYGEQVMPPWIQELLDDCSLSTGVDIKQWPSKFITEDILLSLQTKGPTVIKQVIEPEFLTELERYIHLEQQSEGITTCTDYRKFNGHRNVVQNSLVTKQGWYKGGYAGLVQQALNSHPNLYTCAAELYGTSRICTNFYEYKYSFGQPSNKANELEFFHAGNYFTKLL
jgi:hypothetical protein